MLNEITSLALLISIPWFGGAKDAAPPDTVPTVWKSHSRLALESQFVRAALPEIRPDVGLNLTYDPRQLHVELDADSGTVAVAPRLGDIDLGDGQRLTLAEYARELTWRNFREKWEQESRTKVNSLGTHTPSQIGQGRGLSFALPSPLPPKVQSILGPGGPALTVSGSEIIRLSGQSNWTNQQTGLLGQKPSLFPTLNMQQDLDIQLVGQLSDRIKVNLLQQSANPIPLSNRLKINYVGDEDDLVQALDLGNTSLTLPGTQYVSYSGRNEGLFGAKLSTRVGPLDWTVLASKQEGRSERGGYAGGAIKQTHTLADVDFVPEVYFFLYDPSYQSATWSIIDSSIVLYLDDYNYGNDDNSLRARAFPDPRRALAPADSSDTLSVRGTWTRLYPGQDLDYEILNNIYGSAYKVIRMRRPVIGEQRLAVRYKARRVDANGEPTGPDVEWGSLVATTDFDGEQTLQLKLLRPPVGVLREDAMGNFDTTSVFTRLKALSLKNFYQLPGQNIDPTTFKLVVRQGVDVPPVTVVEKDDGTTVPYFEILGLDSIDETGGFPIFGQQDGIIDGVRDPAVQDAVGTTRVFVDYTNGTLFFPELRPFAPRIEGANAREFEQLLSSTISRRDSLVGAPGTPNAANPRAYDRYTPRRALDAVYYIDVEFTAGQATGEISLGRSNIIEGSEVVTINGEVLQRGRDYEIDYDLGRVTLKRSLAAADNLDIDYSYAPLFQSAGRTLIGSAFRWEGLEKSIGGAFMYESKGAQDLRPRLGEEPSRSIIGDLNTEWAFRPNWMTRMADALPGVRTTTPSELRVQAEVGASFPNPNTQNEVYIDDMEGVRDAISLSMRPEQWTWSSMPSRINPFTNQPEFIGNLPGIYNAELHWYTPPSVIKERDLKPTLTDAQGAQNARQTLALSIPRRPLTAPSTDPVMPDSLWAGLTYLLDPVGYDLSRAQFIEVWVNDWNDYHAGFQQPRVRQRGVKLHIDIGTVSENQIRYPGASPDTSLLDTEDKAPRDNQLTVRRDDPTDPDHEDTGQDGLVSSQEVEQGLPVRDLVTATPSDPSGDDWRELIDPDFDDFEEIDPRNWIYTNGTEDNSQLKPFPDTEDLNLNQIVDTQENYLEYTIDLGDSTHPWLQTDVQRDFGGVALDNGWRRYRIPITDSLAVRFGSPNLALTQHIRVWVSGVLNVDPNPDSLLIPYQRPLLMLGGVDVVGSRWEVGEADLESLAEGTTITLNSVNTIDNAEIYVPPFDPGRTRSGNQELSRREQTLSMEFTGLAPGDTLEAFKTFSIDEDYTRYGTLNWYVAGYQVQGYTDPSDSLFYFVRFASDELGLSYYEYRAPLPPNSQPLNINWQEIRLALTDLSNLKLDPAFPRAKPFLFQAAGSAPGVTYTVKGTPSFTRLRRISFGLMNHAFTSNRTFDEGQLWLDEMRATDVDRDPGYAQRVLVNGRVANLLTYNASWNGRDANFITVGQSLGAGSTTGQLGFGASLDLHRFFEGTGIILPVRYQFSRNTSLPRFSAGDDVVREGEAAAASETSNQTESWSTSYSRQWSDRTNPVLRYTLGGITASISRTEIDNSSPNTAFNSTAVAAAVNYGLSARDWWNFKIPLLPGRFYPFPERAFWNYAVNTRKSITWDRLADTTGTLRLVERSNIQSRAATISFGMNSRPIDLLSHQISGTRNLTLEEELREEWGFINFGRVVAWRQTFSARYQVPGGLWMQPTLQWNSGYTQNNGPEISSDLSVRAVANNQSYTLAWTFPFDRLGMVRATPGDTAGPRRPSIMRRTLALIGGISTDATFAEQSSYSRITGTPNFQYLVGWFNDPGLADSSGRVSPSVGNQASRSSNWRTSARTRMALFRGAGLNARVEFSSRRTDVNSIVQKTDASRFPDLDLDYGQLPKLMGFELFLNNPRLRTAYNRSRSAQYLSSSSPTGISTSSQWQPLIQLQGDLKNGTRADFSIERRVTKRENFDAGGSVTTDRNTDVELTLNRSYSKGQTVNILGRETVVRQTVTLGLTAVYSRQSGETIRTGLVRSQNPVERDRLSVTGNGSYGFNQNVTGTVTLGFGQTRDLQRDIITRNVRVELRAQLTF